METESYISTGATVGLQGPWPPATQRPSFVPKGERRSRGRMPGAGLPSRLVRQMLAELYDHRRIVYTSAYDPEANRIAWLWRWSRREVTQNHQQMTFVALREDIQEHFETLGQHPNLVLRQIGSPFADQKSEAQALAYAA